MAHAKPPQDGDTNDDNRNEGNPNRRRLGELTGTPGGQGRTSLPFPLIAVSVKAAVAGDCAFSELEERFGNPHDRPLDVKHTFPLPPGGAVVAFEIVAGGRTVEGVCKPIRKARAEFATARKRGKTAALVETVRDDVHVVSLANVPPRTEVTVKLSVVERLRCDDGRFEYRFPTTISPKFVPGSESELGARDASGDAAGLSPPLRLAGGTPFHFEAMVPADLAEVGGSVAFSRVDAGKGLVRLRPLAGLTCNGDLVLRLSSRGESTSLRAFTDGERTLVVVDPPARRKPELEAPRIATFLIDRSGSMDGERLAAARRAVAAAIRALGADDRFEIIAFDDRIEALADGPVPATPARIDEATSWLAGLTARGGTEALPALRHACRNRPPAGAVRTVLLVTDGGVGNDGELVEFTRSLDPATRLFTIGIGEATFLSLIDRLARLGGGTSLFLKDSDDIQAEIARLDAALAGPMACGLHEEDSEATGVRDLFAGRSAVFFLEGPRAHVRITSVDGRFDGECEVQLAPMPLGALWARERVLELEDRIAERPGDREVLEARITEIAVQHSIQTRLTAFIAVDGQSQVEGDPIEVVQPVEAPRDAMCFASSAPARWSRSMCSSPMEAPERGWSRAGSVPPQVRGSAGQRRPVVSRIDPLAAAIFLRWKRSGIGSEIARSIGDSIRLLLASLVRPDHGEPELVRQAIDSIRPHAADPRLARFLDAVDRGDLDAAIAAGREVTGQPTLERMLESDRPARS